MRLRITPKITLFTLLSFLLVVGNGICSGEQIIPCEVMDVSPKNRSDLAPLKDLNYILFHHANAEDRDKLSQILKRDNGKDIEFIIDNKRYSGLLYRLPHCFGRGMIIHFNKIPLEPRSLFELVVDDFGKNNKEAKPSNPYDL